MRSAAVVAAVAACALGLPAFAGGEAPGAAGDAAPAAGAVSPVADDAALVPPNGVAGAFVRSGPTALFVADDLYGHIDGGAELFLEFGFERATVQSFRAQGVEIVFEVYRMKDAAAALGVYLMKCGRETPDPSLAARHTIGEQQIQLLKGTRYVLATADAPGPGVREALLAFGRHAAERIADAPAPEELDALPKAGLVARSVRIARGSFGLQPLSTMGDGDFLQLAWGKATLVAGDYAGDGVAAKTIFVARYGTAAAAAKAFADLPARLDADTKIRERAPARLLFVDRDGGTWEATLDGAVVRLALRP